MARRRSGALGWIILLIFGWGTYSALTSHPTNSTVQDNDVIAEPLFSPPAQTEVNQSSTASRSKILYVSASTLNVRATPSGNGTVLLSVPRGTSVVAVSQRGGWYEVKLTNGTTGWMNANYLSEAAPKTEVRVAAPPPPPKKQVDTSAVVQALIAQSQAAYPGNCACPYNTDRAGRSCGRRSAWSKGGGYAPLCYPQDVTSQMIADYLARR